MTMIASFFGRLFGSAPDPRDSLRPLWDAIVASARAPHWYQAGEVPDTLDGRFDMVALILSLVLLRIEQSPSHSGAGVLLTEIFVTDMDGQMRQIGFGDMIVGKQIGHIMGALGGRIGAYRDTENNPGAFAAALIRNLWRGQTPSDAALSHVAAAAASVRAALGAMTVDALISADQIANGAPASADA